jgi:O-antigen/teichoic acid export membrane protein
MSGYLKNFAKHSSIYAVGTLINRVGAFILLPVYTRCLTTEQFGVIELFYSTNAIIASILSIGFAHACIRFYFEYQDPYERKCVMSTALISSFVISVFGIVLLLPFKDFISQIVFNTGEYSQLIPLAFLMLIFDMSIEVNFAFLRAREFSIHFVVIACVKFIVQVTFNIIFVKFYSMGIKGVLLGNMLGAGVTWVLLSFVTIRHNGLNFKFKHFHTMLMYSLPFVWAGVGSIIIANADKYILKSTVSLAAVGIYSLAQKFSSVLKELVFEPFTKNFSPFRFSIMQHKDVSHILSRIQLVFVAGMGLIGLCLTFFSIDVLRIMSSSDYWAAADIVGLLVFAALFDAVAYVFQTGILFAKKTKNVFYISTFSGLLSVVLNLILIPKFRVYGAALNLVIVNFIIVVLTYILAQKVWRLEYKVKNLTFLFGIILVLIGIFHFLPSLPFVVEIMIKLTMLVVFIGVAIPVANVTKEEMISLKLFIYKFISRFIPAKT